MIRCYCSKSHIPFSSGTHYFRGFNNNSQPWCNWNGRRKHGLKPINPTEEGLASIHSVLFRKDPFLWRAALLYYTVYQASQMSFSQLFQDVGKFVKDPNTRWDYCVRAKRGWTDTSQPGGFPICLLSFCTSGRFSEPAQSSFIMSRSKTFANERNGSLHFLKWGSRISAIENKAENAHLWNFQTEPVMDYFFCWKWECKLQNCEKKFIFTVWPPFLFITRDVMLLWMFTDTIFCVWFLSLASGFSRLVSFWEAFQSLGYKYLVFKNKIVLLIMASENTPSTDPERVQCILIPFRLFQ